MKKAVCFLIFFSLTFCKTTSRKTEEINETTAYQLQITQGYLVQCMYPQALIEIKKALDENPKNYLIHDKIGVVYFLMKEYDLAETHFRQSLSLNPKYSEARMNLARTLIEKTSLDEALILVQEAENDLTYTNPSKVYATLGEIYYLKKKPILSKRYLESTKEVNSRICSADYYLGRLSMDQKKYRQALEKFQQTSKCQIKNKEHEHCTERNVNQYFYQGVCEMRLREKKKGAKSLKMFLKLAKSDNILRNQAEKLIKENL